MSRALKGRRILVTRPERETEELAQILRKEGAVPIEAPSIVIEPAGDPAPLDRALRSVDAGNFDWVVFTSPRTVEAVVARLVVLGLPLALAAKAAAVGEKTAEGLQALGIKPDLVPLKYTTDALADAFPEGTGRVLLPRADIAPPGLEDEIAAKGWTPVRVTAYKTVFPDALPAEAREALDAGDVDAAVFTSSSTVEGFVRMTGGAPEGLAIVCIGPVTARKAEEAGLTVDEVADPHTIGGVVEALTRLFKRKRAR